MCPHSEKRLTKDAGVDKVQETEVLQKIVLNGSPREKDPPMGLQPSQSRVRQVLTVLQTMTLRERGRGEVGFVWLLPVEGNTHLITDDQPNFPTVQDGRVEAKGFVGYDEDRGGGTTAMLTHELAL